MNIFESYKNMGAGVFDKFCRRIETDHKINPLDKEGLKAFVGLIFAFGIFGLDLKKVKEIAKNEIMVYN